MMTRLQPDAATRDVLAWSAHAANMLEASEDEAGSDADEPPVHRNKSTRADFKRKSMRAARDHHQTSLLTRALQSQSDEEPALNFAPRGRRRSVNSNISLASTAELTSDTGITSPARTNTPSPPPPEFRLVRLDSGRFQLPRKEPANASVLVVNSPTDKAPEPVKRRCISFACLGKPANNNSARTTPTATTPTKVAPVAIVPKLEAPAPRRPCIKFACPLKPQATQPAAHPPRPLTPSPTAAAATEEHGSPATVRKHHSPSSAHARSGRQHHAQSSTPAKSKKYLAASSNDLDGESARFHEFASDEPQEDDWIRRESVVASPRSKLTMDDILVKENAIRRLGKEAEEEAEQEDEEEASAEVDEEDDAIDNANDDEEEEDEDNSVYGSDDGSDGYRTDEEFGFAESDDEGDESDGDFWTPNQDVERPASAEAAFPAPRRLSIAESHSDSSAYSVSQLRRKSRVQRIKFRPGTPELPDSTDFVCGTFDEDRPLEDAYLSCITQKKKERLRLIPQDIDPSFPTSDPEDDDGEEQRFNPVRRAGDDDSDASAADAWLHGELEDLHHEQDPRRKNAVSAAAGAAHHQPQQSGRVSPRRFHSPAPKARGRSPRRLFDTDSPRRMRSPVPTLMLRSPPASPVVHNNNNHIRFLGCSRGPTQTKSLPRAPALFPLATMLRATNNNNVGGGRKGSKATITTARQGRHVRGAIDIVKGLEQKRQRRKEKFYAKLCNRARKGQIPERRPAPGRGAERMRELGLIMAGKAGPGNYVLSV